MTNFQEIDQLMRSNTLRLSASGLLVPFLLVFLIPVMGKAQLQVSLVDPLQPLFPDSNTTARNNRSLTLDYPAGTVADVHLLIYSADTATLQFNALSEGKALDGSNWFQLIDVPVEQNTGIDSRTEQFKGQFNPYVIRRAPFRIFEAIKPVDGNTLSIKAGYTALRLSVPAKQLNLGTNKILLRFTAHNKDYTAHFTARVFSAELPSLDRSKFFYTNWFRMSEIEKRHSVERWSDAWFNALDQYAALMAYGRQNAIIIPSELIHFESGQLVFEEERMIRFINLFRKYGFQYFESAHLMHRGKNDDWGNPVLKTVYSDADYYGEQANREVTAVITAIRQFTEKYGLTHQWLQHISDEPTAIQGKCYRDIVAQVKKIYPEIKIMEATNDRDSIAGAIDIWCPLINDFQQNESFFRAREQFHEKVLVYTCLIPGGPWLNRLLDQERLRQVYFGWGAAKYRTFGYLHWGLNQYMADPWNQSVVHHPSPAATPNNFLPAGDTHIIYPGDEGPLSSVRFEAHRIGAEDYELLEQLRAKEPQQTEKLVNRLFRSYTEYELSVRKYRKVKKQLLQRLSRTST
jgi:hypothetical protein